MFAYILCKQDHIFCMPIQTFDSLTSERIRRRVERRKSSEMASELHAGPDELKSRLEAALGVFGSAVGTAQRSEDGSERPFPNMRAAARCAAWAV
jgi:hypothetical protein